MILEGAPPPVPFLATCLGDYSSAIVRFYCHVISCALARRGVQHGAAESSVCEHGNTVTRSD